MTSQAPTLVPGLAGIPCAESAVSYIDGQAGILEYRGHRIETLAAQSNFEETAWLLLYGTLPTADELAGFRAKLARYRELPPALLATLAGLPKDGHPMAALQAGYAALGMHMEGKLASRDEDIALLIAATPVMVAAFERARQGQPFVAPDPSLDTAANFLWMLRGETPNVLESHVLDVALVLHADHTMNASTFTARVVASTEADPYTVCASAIGSLKGPLHGGANERVLIQLEKVGTVDRVRAWLDDQLATRGKVMGFGHRVYKTKDPRSFVLQTLARELFEKTGSTPIYDVALELEKAVVEKLGEKGIYPNVDFYSGIVYQKMGIPTDVFTPIFGISRVAGWLAHWREQMVDNKIFRPAQVFVGSHDAVYTDLAARG
ncbi:MAG: citrate synthase [Planctomycetes bacterium]|nr:citrate synthase [Planctomycetota bacterium]